MHVTQPTLSKQIKDLENEFNKTFFERTTRSLSLTEEGMLFKEKAQEIIPLVEQAEDQFKNKTIAIGGDIHIGCSESVCNRIVMKAMATTQQLYPKIRFHITSGNAQFVCEKLDQGLFDLGIVVDPANMNKYDYIKLPHHDTRGILMRKDSELAKLSSITPEDLRNQPLIISSQEMVKNELAGWLGGNQRALNIVATYNLFFNAMLMAEQKVGYVLTLEQLFQETAESLLCFKPLKPALTIKSNVIWKKYKLFPKHIEIFLNILQQDIQQNYQ